MKEHFIDYKSKPITRSAYKVKAISEIIEHNEDCTSTLLVDQYALDFKHYEPVAVGDYIVYLNETDVYHCTAKVFEERNIV
jgi:hypothetical protein